MRAKMRVRGLGPQPDPSLFQEVTQQKESSVTRLHAFVRIWCILDPARTFLKSLRALREARAFWILLTLYSKIDKFYIFFKKKIKKLIFCRFCQQKCNKNYLVV